MEGPSIHLLSEELQSFVHQKILALSGNAQFDKEHLVNQEIKDIYAFGKQLIIQLTTDALVTHFLMYGSYRINQERVGFAPRIALVTPHNTLFLYNCSTKTVPTDNLKQFLSLEFDILSPLWDIKKIVQAMRKHPNSTIDDVLLDQAIFAGVGNIIKNDVLFLCRVAPTTLVRTLSVKKLKEIAATARAFSQKFLEWRRQCMLKKNLFIYRKKLCPQCNSPIIRKKTGIKNRWSYICPVCQPF